MDVQQIEWSEFDFGKGLPSIPRAAPASEFRGRMHELRDSRDASVEVAVEGRRFPWVNLSLRNGYGVVHGFTSEESVKLLVTAMPFCSEPVQMPVLDTETLFSPEFVHGRDAACDVVERFAAGASLADLGAWKTL